MTHLNATRHLGSRDCTFQFNIEATTDTPSQNWKPLARKTLFMSDPFKLSCVCPLLTLIIHMQLHNIKNKSSQLKTANGDFSCATPPAKDELYTPRGMSINYASCYDADHPGEDDISRRESFSSSSADTGTSSFGSSSSSSSSACVAPDRSPLPNSFSSVDSYLHSFAMGQAPKRTSAKSVVVTEVMVEEPTDEKPFLDEERLHSSSSSSPGISSF